MKTLPIILTALISFAAMAQSQKSIEAAPANFVKALQSDNAGMAESAIFHALKYKIYYPEQNTNAMEKEIAHLVKNGETDAFCYKAFLANQLLKNDELMSRLEKKQYKEADEFFKMLGDQLNKHILAAK